MTDPLSLPESPTGSLIAVCLGAALVDVLGTVDDAHLDTQGLVKGSMALVDTAAAELLYGALPPTIEVSGGSAANTAAGICSLGGAAAFVGKVHDDQLGSVFRHDIRAAGVHFDVTPDGSSTPTGRCLIHVTPDGERTMCTYLGASQEVAGADIDAASDLVGSALFAYIEGYAWDWPDLSAILAATLAALGPDGRLALSLSDPFCVERHRDAYLAILPRVGVLLGNEDEALSLMGAATLEEAFDLIECPVVAITQGARGATVRFGGPGSPLVAVAAAPADQVVDTTGAGDLYAAGFLVGLAGGLDASRCGALGALCAAEVISHLGARPQVPLSELAAAAGLLPT